MANKPRTRSFKIGGSYYRGSGPFPDGQGVGAVYDGVVRDANGRPIVVRWSRLVATDDRLHRRSVEVVG